MNDYRQEFMNHLMESGDYQPKTIKFYRDQTRCIMKVMSDVIPDTTPITLDAQSLKTLVAYLRDNYAISTQKCYLVALRGMCEFYGNNVFRLNPIRFPTDMRPNVDWLSYDQAQTLINVWKMPLEEMIIVLELLHGLRRVEVIRLRMKDIHFDRGYIDIRGKGRAGGKLRAVPMHPDFRKAYDRWMVERKAMVKKAEEGTGDDRLLVYLKGTKLRHYEELKGGAIDNHVAEISTRVGFHFSNHTLRRTFGRELFRSGVSIVVIATIFGHSNTSTTMKYLGLTMDDMTEAMERFRLRRLD